MVYPISSFVTLQNTNLVANVNSFDLASEDFAIVTQFEVDTKSDGSGMRSEMSKPPTKRICCAQF